MKMTLLIVAAIALLAGSTGDDEQRVHEWPSLLVRSRCQYPTSRKNGPQLIASDSRSRCFLPRLSSRTHRELDSGVSEHKFKIGQLVYFHPKGALRPQLDACLLYTSDAADE